MQWLPLAEKWAGQGVVPVPVALVLAIIQMESAGNPLATRSRPMRARELKQQYDTRGTQGLHIAPHAGA